MRASSERRNKIFDGYERRGEKLIDKTDMGVNDPDDRAGRVRARSDESRNKQRTFGYFP